jgi:hypothetical protein
MNVVLPAILIDAIQPLELDLTTLDPPGMNQGIGRFSKTDV